jgi:hypothetical protein
VLLQQGEMHPAIYALALCLNAAPPDCHKPRCDAMLANTAIRFCFIDTWVGGSFSKSIHSLFHGPFIEKT